MRNIFMGCTVKKAEAKIKSLEAATAAREAAKKDQAAAIEIEGFKKDLAAAKEAAEKALEDWLFDQNQFKESANSVEEAADEPAKPRPSRKQKKEQDTVAEDLSGDET